MSICFILLTFSITNFIGEIFSSIFMMNSMGGNGAGGSNAGGNDPGGGNAGGNGPQGNGPGGNGPGGNNSDALPSMDVPVRDDFISARSAYGKISRRHAEVGNPRAFLHNLFDSNPEDPINNLTYREKEAVVSSINGYRFGGEAADPEKAMIKGSRGSEGFDYTSNGKAARNGSLV